MTMMNMVGVCAVMMTLVAGAAFAMQGTTPKKAYLLVQADITNPEQYQNYAKLSPGIIAKYGGTYLARAGRTKTLEGAAAKSRVVVIEFPSFEAAERFYTSEEYQSAMKLRAGAATAQFIVVEGI
jgi:uncharacterized protein (DUF1330 family)